MNMKVVPGQTTLMDPVTELGTVRPTVEITPVQDAPLVVVNPDAYALSAQVADIPRDSQRTTQAVTPLHGSALQAQFDSVGTAGLQQASQAGTALAAVYVQGEKAAVSAPLDIDDVYGAWTAARREEVARNGAPTVEDRLKEIEHLLAAGLVGPGSHAEAVLEKAGLISLHQKFSKLDERKREIERQTKRPTTPALQQALELELVAVKALYHGYTRVHEEADSREKLQQTARMTQEGAVRVQSEINVLQAALDGMPGIERRMEGLRDDPQAQVELRALISLWTTLKDMTSTAADVNQLKE